MPIMAAVSVAMPMLSQVAPAPVLFVLTAQPAIGLTRPTGADIAMNATAVWRAPPPRCRSITGRTDSQPPMRKRLGRNVVMIPARGADGLAAAVTAATTGIGQPPPKRRGTGHMTIARFRREPPPDQWPPEDPPTIDTSFVASEMARVQLRSQ